MIILEEITDLLKEEIEQGFDFKDHDLFNQAFKLSKISGYSSDEIIYSFNTLKQFYNSLKSYEEKQIEIRYQKILEEERQKRDLNFSIYVGGLTQSFKPISQLLQNLVNSFRETEKNKAKENAMSREVLFYDGFKEPKKSNIIELIKNYPWFFLRNKRNKVFSFISFKYFFSSLFFYFDLINIGFYSKSKLAQKISSSFNFVFKKVTKDFRFYYFSFGV